MQFTKKAEILSVAPKSFVNGSGETIQYYKAILLVEDEILEVNTSDKEKYQILKDNLRTQVDIDFKLFKNKYGTYKISV